MVNLHVLPKCRLNTDVRSQVSISGLTYERLVPYSHRKSDSCTQAKGIDALLILLQYLTVFNRKIKLESKTNILKWSSPYFPPKPYRSLKLKFIYRMIEALTDPKTWLFALFSALDNVPNSLTNQRQIIESSFGFTNLQTTLLGCVDGVVEIVTIWTGVTLAARIPDARAYVGFIYFIPNVMGVFLINFLPWSDKVGLLFAQWTTGLFIHKVAASHVDIFRCWHYWIRLITVVVVKCNSRPYQASHR